MTRTYYTAIAVLLMACFILVIPASALQSAEQSIGGSMTRGSRFTVSITGLPNTAYYIWLPGTSDMTGEQYDRPPVIASGLAKIEKDPTDGPYTIGSYQYNNGGGSTIRDDVAPSVTGMSNTNYYAQVTTDETGYALVEFQTSVYTGLRSYSVKVENPSAPESENFQVTEKIYSRSVSKPMINTPAYTVVTTSPAPELTTIPTPAPTPLPDTLPETTPVPTTTPLPTQKSSLDAGIATVALGIGLVLLGRK
ncbi:MAG: hypothetical protein PHT99_03040 [Methanoregula sp.]|nr:hypothetical protein [Methanoregula sp.]